MIIKTILIKSILAFAIKISGALLGLIVTLYLTRSIGAEKAGIYFLCVTILNLLSLISTLGVNNLALKLVSKYSSEGLYYEVKHITYVFMKMILCASILVSCSLVLINAFGWLDEKYSFGINIIAMTLFFFSVYTMLSFIIQGRGKVLTAMMLIGGLQQLLTLLIMLSIGIEDSNEALLSLGLAHFITFIISLIIIFIANKTNFNEHHCCNSKNKEKGDSLPSMKSLLQQSFPMLIIQVMSQINSQIGILLLGFFSMEKGIALLTVSMKIAFVISLILIAVNKVIAPNIANLYAQGKFNELQDLITKSARVLVFSAATSLLFILIIQDNLLGMFGSEFKGGAICLIILAAGQFVNVSLGSVGYLLQLTNYANEHRKNVVISFIATLSIGFFLVIYFGVNGAAGAVFLGLCLTNGLSYLSVKKKLKINTLKLL